MHIRRAQQHVPEVPDLRHSGKLWALEFELEVSNSLCLFDAVKEVFLHELLVFWTR